MTGEELFQQEADNAKVLQWKVAEHNKQAQHDEEQVQLFQILGSHEGTFIATAGKTKDIVNAITQSAIQEPRVKSMLFAGLLIADQHLIRHFTQETQERQQNKMKTEIEDYVEARIDSLLSTLLAVLLALNTLASIFVHHSDWWVVLLFGLMTAIAGAYAHSSRKKLRQLKSHNQQ